MKCETCSCKMIKIYWKEGGAEWYCERCREYSGIAVEPKGDK